MSWEMKPISELCIFAIDCVNKTAPVVEYETPYKMIRTTNVKDGFIDLETVRYVEEETFLKWTRRSKPQYGDVIFTREAPVGSVGRFTSNDPNVFLGQRLFHYRPDPELLDWQYLTYILQSDAIQGWVNGIAFGATVPHIKVKDAEELKIPCPPIGTQRKIGAILSAYDDLIENNLKRIKLLEEMAQITYEEWFVSMKFPGHEIAAFDEETRLPKGWSTRNLGYYIEHEIGGGWGEEEASKEFSETAYVIRGTDFDGLSTGNTKNVPLRWHKKSNLASRKLTSGDIIFEVSGGSQNEGVAKTVLMTEELLSLFDEDVMCASFCKLARPKSTEVGHYLFYFLRFLRKIKASEVFEIRSASNIVNYNWTAFLKFQEVNLPSKSLLDEFYVISENSTKQISVLAKQIKLLKEAGDILLPRLMTGMIDIEQVELPEAMLKRLEEQEDKMATAV
jgi:type I restriction enzyme S subunit